LKNLYAEDYFISRKDYFYHNPVSDAGAQPSNESIGDFARGLTLIGRFKPKGKLLDVGCGVGVFLAIAEKEGWDARGIDVSEYAVSEARGRFGLKAVAGDLCETDLPERSFDAVTLWDAFEHMPHPTGVLGAIRRLLKDDGLFFLNIPNEESLLRVLASGIYAVSGGLISYPVRKLYHRFHLFYYSAATMGALLKKAGFDIVHLERKRIPIEKGRMNSAEKAIVKALSYVERLTGKEYELVVVARKAQGRGAPASSMKESVMSCR